MIYKIKSKVPDGVKRLICALPDIFDSQGVRKKTDILSNHINKNEMSDEDYEFIFKKWADSQPGKGDPHKIAKRIFDIIKDEMFEY